MTTPTPSRLLAIAGLAAAVTAVLALVVDAPLARAIGPYEAWPTWNTGIHALEYLAGIEPWSGITATVLCATTLAMRLRWPTHLPACLFVTTTYLLAHELSGGIKTLTGRLRPYEWLAKGGDMWLREGGIAFPSGHVVLFAGLAIPIAIVAPRLRAPMLAVVAFAMVARVAVNAHYASDVVGAIALVCACAALWSRVILAPAAPGSPQPPASR